MMQSKTLLSGIEGIEVGIEGRPCECLIIK